MEDKLDISTLESVKKCIEEFTKEFLEEPTHYDSSKSFSFRYNDFRPEENFKFKQKKDIVARLKKLNERKPYSKTSFKNYFLNK